MSMYGDYIRERLGDSIFETEIGFATFRYLPNNVVYIIDIYVKPDFRRSGEAKLLADAIKDVAKEKGCTTMMGTVVPTANGSTDSMKALLAYGFRIKSAGNDFIIFEREI